MKLLIDYILQYKNLTEAEQKLISNHVELKSFKKRQKFLAAGQKSQEVYFILHGCLRLFYLKDGADISAYFFTENSFAGAYDSFTSQQPSRHYIEAIEDGELLVLKKKNLEYLYLNIPGMNEIIRRILEERFYALHQLFTSQILDSPEERYQYLLENNPDLLQRIPQHQIATFLGVTPVSLSRIRNRITKR